MNSVPRAFVVFLLVTLVLSSLSAAVSASSTDMSDLQVGDSYSHCGSKIIHDLATVRPAGWSDMAIANCDAFAPPATDIRTAVAQREATAAQAVLVAYQSLSSGSVGGWSDVGTSQRAASVGSWSDVGIAQRMLGTGGGTAGWHDAGASR